MRSFPLSSNNQDHRRNQRLLLLHHVNSLAPLYIKIFFLKFVPLFTELFKGDFPYKSQEQTPFISSLRVDI
jgi:hypothetical protein